ncbi:GNAT family N-acetyltransferase [Aquimarina sp. 2201CG5-10]|uniref:GNAT family N-acetyltransferase n=1 Tax=Aquimarina callyspongiae TaxID=3098150 RepID=UPI002AB4C375|nr:GNAT family N-acetyltransferase [Aquimarina sp. 2201CG5-10]MDY8138948.1 GNAT family N-acetyltransferase [Aquimarina sp. 2201CG5-10]
MKSLLLNTNRLELKIVQLSELSEVHKLHSTPEVDQYNTLGIPTNKEVTGVYLEEWVENFKMRKEFVFTIRLKVDNSFVGLISLKIGNPKYKIGSLWYKLSPEFWSLGYATEAAREVVRLGFEELNLHRIEAGCAVDNVGSIKVLEKIGMLREGSKRKVLPLITGWADNYEYAILEEDWFKK